MVIKSIGLMNWKNFRKTDGYLSDRMFLIGPNASGKSNLLDAFRFLRDVAESGLAKSVAKRGGISSIRCLSARKISYVELNIQIEDIKSSSIWGYKLRINQDKASRPVIEEELVTHNKKTLLRRPEEADKNDPLRLTQTALEQIIANQSFRDIADFFKSISYQHIIPQVVRDPKGFSPESIQNDPFGRDFLRRIWDTNKKVRDARLRNISKVLKIAIPQLEELEVEQDKQGAPHLIGRYTYWRPNAAKQYEQQFSDGTLRLFGLLWSLFEGNGPLLLEEPELSLHDEVVRYLPQLFEQVQKKRKSRRQVIISTHSKEILSDSSIGAEEVLWLEPTSGGTVIQTATNTEREALKQGLTIADILLPRSAPKNSSQLTLDLFSL